MGSSLLCDRVQLPSTSFPISISISINDRASSLVWVVLWFFLVADTPSKVAPKLLKLILNVQHPYISNEEKKHIEESLGLGEVNKLLSTPLFAGNTL